MSEGGLMYDSSQCKRITKLFDQSRVFTRQEFSKQRERSIRLAIPSTRAMLPNVSIASNAGFLTLTIITAPRPRMKHKMAI